MKKNGFTLLELLVVIAIIGILAAGVIAALRSARAKARDARRFQDMHAIITAIQLFYDDYGDVPASNNGGPNGNGEQIGVGGLIDSALAPYLPRVPKDPSHDGVNYFYAYDPAHCVNPPSAGQCALDDGYCTGFSDRWKAMVSVERFEVTPLAQLQKDTCGGGDQGINNANYNIVVAPEDTVDRIENGR